jgi:formylglycine-generating enzyme required for sulfatase activity
VRFHRIIAAAWLALMCAVAPAHAEKRVALVIGNSTYTNISQLRNPTGDARLIADTLRGLGFSLVGGGPLINLDKAGLDRAVQSFGAQLQGADVGLFYYAGHGIQMHGANYLVPVDANVTREADADFRMLNVNLVLQQMDPADQPGGRLNVVILDACRNNPFGGRGLRSVDRGLGPMQAPGGTLISFATQPGNVAQDGDGDHSPFTMALADSIRRPGIGLFDTFNEIGLRVQRATGGAQQPWVSSSPIAGQFYLGGLPPPKETAPPGPAPVSDAERTWGLIQHTTSLAALDDFIRQFGNAPIYGALARARREEVAKPAPGQQIAVVAPLVKPAVPAADPCGGPATASLPSRCAAPLTAAQERGLKPKDTFRECESCPEMVVVPAGSFTMGSPQSDKGRSSDEGPQHVVTIGRQFAVGKLHVTVDQFSAFVRETRYEATKTCYKWPSSKRDGSWRDPGFVQEGSHPVVCVSWDDANAYTKWLAKKTSKPYRLLSEAEFEYAARGRTSPGVYPRFWFGNDEKDLCRYGNGADQKARDSIEEAKSWTIAPCNDGYAFTSPAERYEPNAFGLHDMAGNAWQWTADCYHDNYNGAPADGAAWTADTCNSSRVLRGGSWYFSGPRSLRAADRYGYSVEYYDIGFRVARTLTP